MPPINYLAVIVAAVATFALGALWYSPALFAKPWVRAHGYTPEKVEAMRKGAGKAYGSAFVCYLVMAFMMAILAGRTGAATLPGGVRLGVVVWLGFAATIGMTAQLFSETLKLGVYAIDAGYQLVYLMLQGVILALWR
jgi:hypothetical protein